jgi:hypothetical protein
MWTSAPVNPLSDPERARVVATVLRVAFMASVLVYGLVAFLVKVAEPPASGDGQAPLVFGVLMGVVAAACLAIGLLLPRLVGSDEALEAAASGAAAPFDAAMRCAVASFIVRLALFEAVAVLGLVLAFATGKPSLYLPFGLVALMAMAPVRLDVDHVCDVAQRAARR